MGGDEPAVLEGGADDGGFLGVVLHDEVVADGGGVVGNDASEIGGGKLQREEIRLREVGEDVEPYFGGYAVERERGCHFCLNLDIKDIEFFFLMMAQYVGK